MIAISNKYISVDDVEPLSCNILIVDDSETDRATYRRYLESGNEIGYQICDCETGEDALDFCDRHCPDVILLDYLLPDTDGLQFLEELTERIGKLPPIVMLTGQGNEAIAVEAMKHGVRDYLVKGQLTPQRLVNSVTNALTAQKLQSQIDSQKRQSNLLASIMLKVGHSIDLAEILQAGVDGARELLECDRTMVYKLNPDLSGTIVSESVLPQWSPSLGQKIEENCFQGEHSHSISKYLNGHKVAISNIRAAELSPCYVEMLERFQVKAVLVVPILLREVSPASAPTVWGLLIAHHCKTAREWKADELNLLDEMSVQMEVAIQKAELVLDLQQTLAKQQAVDRQLRDRVIEIEQTNLRLSLATNLLEKRNQELDEFACIASHDLQAPLRGISNLADWLAKDLDDKLPVENQQQLNLIQSRVQQMNALINGLLLYARVGRENVDPTTVNISEILREVIETIDPPADFKVHFASHLPTLTTQALLLKQVFANLIGNAIKYHDRTDGTVEILVKDRDYFWQFTVVDDGPGIAPEHHKNIFGIFQTLMGRDSNKGSGIGLAIVQKIVESRGGSVWLESALGEGSAFSFTWPKIL
ncbi:ATP-binding protein [Chamaesiphon minutus]|uniref:histidine kinase n=1 Tax=Chamaesiphon minutus (strain ATCC 27169 / PCC 6605) TaxID=1173020 RepID=K9UKB7_CHAP6|nr:ATP-binding protein [Chamaesiphon minutus]AFY94876.1 bacteriophytochrome (light-regulated signal transduction histidine kinase) [Chamaesiphon minutus PCC 6605]